MSTDGKLVEVTGDPDHPMTRGGLCVKLKDFAQHHYNPERVLYPMRRVGPKGAGEFERISWDEALAEIKQRWDEIIATARRRRRSCLTPIWAIRAR